MTTALPVRTRQFYCTRI